jgi:plasmid stabilization system protein ParE
VRYRVIVAPAAEADLQAAYRYIRDRAPRAAKEWIREVRSSIRTLARFPERCPMSPESTLVGMPIRQLFFGRGSRGTYRILFTVSEKSVNVVHVRHGSMLTLGAGQRSDD